MRVYFFVLLALSGLMGPLSAWSAQFFVDGFNVGGHGCSPSNAGTDIDHPVCTIAQGRTLLNAAPGVGHTLWIRGGNYGESIVVSKADPLPSGSSWASATVVAGYNGETVQLSGGQGISFPSQEPGNPAQEQLFQYIILKNFKIQGGGGGVGALGCGYSGLASRMGCGAHFIRFDTIEVVNLGGVGFCPGGAFGNGYGATDLEYLNVTAHDGGGTNCPLNSHGEPSPNGHGFYTNAERTLIDNAHVYNMTGYGLQIFDSGCPHTVDFIYDCGKDSVIRNSSFHHNGNGTTSLYGGLVIGHASGMEVYNNIVYNNRNNGIELGYASTINTKVYNNIVYGSIQGCGICIATATSGSLIKNNLLINNPTNIQPNANTSYTADHNICSAAGAVCDIVATPTFTNVGGADFTLQAGSRGINEGTPLTFRNPNGTTYASVDKALVSRPQGSAWDIGAYEYVEGGSTPISGNPIYLSAGGHGDTPTDSGDCSVPETITTPRATLAAALLCMQIPGKVLYIRGGTYAGKIDTSGGQVVGGNAAMPTRIEGYGSEVVTIQLNEDGVPAVYLQGITSFTLNKVTVNAMGRPFSNGLACVGATNIKVLNSTFHNSYFEAGYLADCVQVEVTQSTFYDSATKAVIGLAGSITNVTLDQVEVYNGPLEGLKANVGSGSNSSLTISRSQIHHTGTGAGGAALDLGPGTGALLVNNILDHNNAGVRIRAGANGTKIYHNAIASNTPGVGMQCDAPARTGVDIVTLANNISFGNGTDPVVNNCSAIETSPPTMTTNPLWVDVAGRNFQLQTTPVPSPALDQLSTVPPEAAIAIDGTTRPVGFLSDLGPFEQAKPDVPIAPTTVLPLLTRYLGMWY